MENLIKIENVLNDHEQWELENGCVDYQLRFDNNNNLSLMIYCEDETYEKYEIELTEDYSVKSILKTIINYLYENEVNFRQNFIKKTKGFNSRKIKSLTLWSVRNKQDKVNQINQELIERHNTTQKFKNELITYKDYVRDLYSCLNELCPYHKVLDIREYMISKFEENNIKNIEIYFTEDYIIVCRYVNGELNKRIEVKIDNFSRKQSVYNTVVSQLNSSVCDYTDYMKEMDKTNYEELQQQFGKLQSEKEELLRFESILTKTIGGRM